jgi:glycosyltransferase-like protein
VNIALVTYSTKPRGGVVHTLSLAEALAAAGANVTVWTLGRGGDAGFFRPVDPAVRQVIVPFPDRDGEETGARVLRSIAMLQEAFDPAGYDVVHAQDCISANAAGRCLRTVHHIDHFRTPELAACHERAISEPFGHICVSEAVARDLRDGWGISATVIPNGVDAARFAAAAGPSPAAVAARAAWRYRLARGGLERFVLAVGGIEPRKGSIDLLDSFGQLVAARPGLAGLGLVIAGGETLFDYRPYRAAWQARADELGLAPLVLGPVPHHELPALAAAADVFAFPSTVEGFGLAAMEALAAGVPVVTRDLPVLREVFGGAARFGADVDGLAVALGDALDQPDPALTAAGRELASGHSWAAAAEQHLGLYRSLAAAGAL